MAWMVERIARPTLALKTRERTRISGSMFILYLFAKDCDKGICVLKVKQKVRAVLATSAENWRKAFGSKVLYSTFLCVSCVIIVRDALGFAEAGHGEFDPAPTVVRGAHVFNGD